MIFVLSFWILFVGLIVAARPAQPRWQRIGAVNIAILLVLTFLQTAGFLGPIAVAGDATNYSPALIFALGVIVLLFFSAVLIAQRTPTPPSHMQTGSAVFAAVVGVYLMFVAVDHWWFFRGDDELNGWASPSAMGVKEVDCDFALARIEGDAISYRCAHLFIFGRAYAHPFVPWPSYTSGTSIELKVKQDELMREATRNAPPGGFGAKP